MNEQPNDSFELELVAALQPIRQLVLANCLWHLFEHGIYDELSSGPKSVATICKARKMDPVRLGALLTFLRNEGIVQLEEGVYQLTAAGRAYERFRPWYTMLVGGYGATFRELGPALYEGSPPVGRDADAVGVGSCGISHFGAIPLTRYLMSRSSQPCRRLLDLGCGNALYLVEFCRAMPEIKAWGVEPSQTGYESAKRLVVDTGLGDRIELFNAGALEFIRKDDVPINPDFTVLGFVLHEILGQAGEAGVIEFLTALTTRFPALEIIVIEVDTHYEDPKMMRHSTAIAYYNSYCLLHPFTNQRLESAAYWEGMFARCGLEIVERKSISPNADSTGMEVGFLLRKRT
jgi:2-ketoarginine methyltransferase